MAQIVRATEGAIMKLGEQAALRGEITSSRQALAAGPRARVGDPRGRVTSCTD